MLQASKAGHKVILCPFVLPLPYLKLPCLFHALLPVPPLEYKLMRTGSCLLQAQCLGHCPMTRHQQELSQYCDHDSQWGLPIHWRSQGTSHPRQLQLYLSMNQDNVHVWAASRSTRRGCMWECPDRSRVADTQLCPVFPLRTLVAFIASISQSTALCPALALSSFSAFVNDQNTL